MVDHLKEISAICLKLNEMEGNFCLRRNEMKKRSKRKVNFPSVTWNVFSV